MGVTIDLHLDGNATVTGRVWPPASPTGKPYATLEFDQPGGTVRVYVSSPEQLRELAREVDRAAFILAGERLERDLVDIRCLESDFRGEAA